MAETIVVTGELTSQLSSGVTSRGVSLAYGAKQTIDKVTLIPVAFVSDGFGASEGSDSLGSGGGGGGVSSTIGCIVRAAR